MSADLVLSVIRGDQPLSSLRDAGVSLRYHQADPEAKTRQIVVKQRNPLSVQPTATDLARGLLQYKMCPRELRNWGTFILAADLVDLEPLESDPHGDEILNGIWEASFEGHVSDNVLTIAEQLAGESPG